MIEQRQQPSHVANITAEALYGVVDHTAEREARSISSSGGRTQIGLG